MSKLVPLPTDSLVPERDAGKMPILEARHLGIEFGGLKAVDDFNLTIGRTEIAGLIGPNGAADLGHRAARRQGYPQHEYRQHQ